MGVIAIVIGVSYFEKLAIDNQWIGENTPEEPKRKPRKLGKVETADGPQSGRSIFDDIDADDAVETS